MFKSLMCVYFYCSDPSDMRKGFWDRHGANKANYYEGIYDEKVLRRPKTVF